MHHRGPWHKPTHLIRVSTTDLIMKETDTGTYLKTGQRQKVQAHVSLFTETPFHRARLTHHGAHVNKDPIMRFISLPFDRFLDLSKLKAFADNKISVT